MNAIINRLKKRKDDLANAGWISGLRLVQHSLTFATLIALGRYFEKSEFGTYTLLLAYTAIANLATLPGFRNAAIQSVARGYNKTYQNALYLSLSGSLAGAIGLSLALSLGKSLELPQAMPWILGSIFPFSHGLSIWDTYFIGHQRFKTISLLKSASHIAMNSTLIALSFSGFLTISQALIVTLAVPALQNIIGNFFVFKKRNKTDKSESGSLRYGLQSSAIEMLNTVANHLDKILLNAINSPSELAIYAVASKIPETLKKNIQSFTEILKAKFATKEHFTKSHLKWSLLIWLGITTIIILPTTFLIQWLLPIAFDNKYDDSIFYCQLLLASLSIGIAATILFSFIQSKQDTKSNAIITLGSCAIRITLSVILVSKFGILGACLSTILYRISTISLVVYRISKYKNERKHPTKSLETPVQV